MDRYPGGRALSGVTPDWMGRTETVKKLLDAGYAHRVMLGHDWSIIRRPRARDGTPYPGQRSREEERDRYNPDAYLFITRNVLPRLREMGEDDDAIDQMMVRNPRRFFEGP